jgi:hypothetical protein
MGHNSRGLVKLFLVLLQRFIGLPQSRARISPKRLVLIPELLQLVVGKLLSRRHHFNLVARLSVRSRRSDGYLSLHYNIF